MYQHNIGFLENRHFFAEKLQKSIKMFVITLIADHELYSTLLNEHNGDFRNSNAKSVPPEQV
jgi:hypothetical protein